MAVYYCCSCNKHFSDDLVDHSPFIDQPTHSLVVYQDLFTNELHKIAHPVTEVQSCPR